METTKTVTYKCIKGIKGVCTSGYVYFIYKPTEEIFMLETNSRSFVQFDEAEFSRYFEQI